MSETTRPAHLSPKPFIALEEARIALDALDNSVRTARVELSRIEERASALLLSDEDVRELLIEFSLVDLAMKTWITEHPLEAERTPEQNAVWSELCRRDYKVRHALHAIGDNFIRSREAMAARIAEEAKKGVAA